LELGVGGNIESSESDVLLAAIILFYMPLSTGDLFIPDPDVETSDGEWLGGELE
jgi:hypothetical protein